MPALHLHGNRHIIFPRYIQTHGMEHTNRKRTRVVSNFILDIMGFYWYHGHTICGSQGLTLLTASLVLSLNQGLFISTASLCRGFIRIIINVN